jgi:hypothetical protein
MTMRSEDEMADAFGDNEGDLVKLMNDELVRRVLLVRK